MPKPPSRIPVGCGVSKQPLRTPVSRHCSYTLFLLRFPDLKLEDTRNTARIAVRLGFVSYSYTHWVTESGEKKNVGREIRQIREDGEDAPCTLTRPAW